MLGVLLGRAGALRSSALSSIRAEDGYFDATILLPIISRFFVVDRLILAESDDLNAIDGDIMLRYEVGLHGLGAATAEVEVIFGSAGLVREAFDGHEIALHASDLGAAELVELLFRIIGQLCGIEFEQYGA